MRGNYIKEITQAVKNHSSHLNKEMEPLACVTILNHSATARLLFMLF
jgi:hypothetical protein